MKNKIKISIVLLFFILFLMYSAVYQENKEVKIYKPEEIMNADLKDSEYRIGVVIEITDSSHMNIAERLDNSWSMLRLVCKEDFFIMGTAEGDVIQYKITGPIAEVYPGIAYGLYQFDVLGKVENKTLEEIKEIFNYQMY